MEGQLLYKNLFDYQQELVNNLKEKYRREAVSFQVPNATGKFHGTMDALKQVGFTGTARKLRDAVALIGSILDIRDFSEINERIYEHHVKNEAWEEVITAHMLEEEQIAMALRIDLEETDQDFRDEFLDLIDYEENVDLDQDALSLVKAQSNVYSHMRNYIEEEKETTRFPCVFDGVHCCHDDPCGVCYHTYGAY